MSASPIVYRVELDRKPFLNLEYDGDITDLTILLRVRRQNNTLIEIPATVDDAENGLFHFEWGDGDLTVGTHLADVVFTDGDELPFTLPDEGPIRLVVRKKV